MKPHPPRGRKYGQAKYAVGPGENTNSTISSKPGSITPKRQSWSPTKLAESLHLLDSIFVRHKNQHRSQAWWKPMSLLRKSLRKYVALETRENELKNPVRAVEDAKAVRRRFELEAQVRREREMLGAWISETLCPRCYVTFSGVVADTQFANLGVVLMGVLAEIGSVVGLPQGLESAADRYADVVRGIQDAKRRSRSVTAYGVQVVGAERGTLVERIYESDDLGEVIERRGHSPSTREPPRSLHADHDIRPSSISRGAEERAPEAKISPGKTQELDDNHFHEDDVEMRDESRALDTSSTVTLDQKRGTVKAQKSATQHPRNRDRAEVIREKRTKNPDISSQTAVVSSLPPSSRSSKTHSSSRSSPLPKQAPSTSRNSDPQTAGTEVPRKQKRLDEGEEPGRVENRIKKKAKDTGADKSKKKKRNVIDDMFAGFG